MRMRATYFGTARLILEHETKEKNFNMISLS